MLNTRVPLAVGRSDESSQTVVNYGLPDFSMLNAASPAHRAELAALIEAKITAFEPRLRQVRVTLEPDPANGRNLAGTMQAILNVASLSEPVSFPILLGNSGILLEETANQAVQQSDYAGR